MKRLLLLSGKGGTGKTTAAAAFVAFSKTRAFADCDVDAPNLHLVAGLDTMPEETVFIGSNKAKIDPHKCIGCGICEEKCRFHAINNGVVNEYACEGCGVCAYVCPADAVALHPDEAGTQMLYRGHRVFSTAKLKMGRGNSGKLVTNVKLALLKNAPETDLAIIDGSPGIGCPVIASVSGMDLVLVVTEPSISGRSDLARLVKTAGTFQTNLAVCVNKWDTSPENTQVIRQFCEDQGIPFLGTIPYDKTVCQAVNQEKSVAELDCPAAEALYQIYCGVLSLLEVGK